MAKKRKWVRAECGCVRTKLPSVGKALIRCSRHRSKPSKRALLYFDADGIVRKDAA